MLDQAITQVLAAARAEGREVLLETEGLALARELGLGTPAYVMVSGSREVAAADLSALPGEKVVVKVLSPAILHKSDVGGVAVVAREPAAIARAVAVMEERFAGTEVVGYSINELIPHDASFGGQLLLGMRWTEDFGPVVTFGPGGIYTELLAESFRPGRDVAILSPALGSQAAVAAALAGKAVTPVVTGRLRGQPARLEEGVLMDLLLRFLAFAADAMPTEVRELELNPVVLTEGGPVALDALVRLGPGAAAGAAAPSAAPRPLAKLRHLLTPRSAAVMGVSRKLNPGHIILNNLLAQGFDRRHLYVVKPGLEELEGCRCVPAVSDLPEAVDLLVLAIDAAQVPAAVEEVLAGRKAESLIVIPGGLGERSGSESHVERVQEALAEARSSEWRGPVINGGNCLGVRSLPGKVDTLFIPGHKLSYPQAESPLALLSQSGAFAVARASNLAALNPRYLVTLGNQLDLTVSDYLAYLADDPEVAVFACYVEGFRPGDGRRFLEVAARITAAGRPVILYRAGRTATGARAAASHTASIAGDYAVTRELARAAGVVLAESLADFDDLVRLFTLLRGKEVAGLRLGALSNAGFECVAMADSVGPFQLAAFSAGTAGRLTRLFEAGRIGAIVEVHNPVDVTPTFGDEAFAAAARAVLEDVGVDVGIIGCVPLTGALQTLPAGDGHREDITSDASVVQHLVELAAETPKAWVAVVDSGPLFDPMARALEATGIPTFRTADRALRHFATFCRWRLETLARSV